MGEQRAVLGINIRSTATRPQPTPAASLELEETTGAPATTPLGPEETTSSHSNRRQPEPEQYQHAFMGITVPLMARRPVTTPSSLEPEKASEESWCIDNAETVSSAADEIYIPTPPSLDRFNNNTGYEGVTFKERGCQRTPVLDRASLCFSFKLTAEPPAFPSHLRVRSSVTLAEPETFTTVPSPHCSSVTLAETETSTTVPSPHCSPVTLAETETSTTVPSPQCSSVTLAETETSATVPSPHCSSVTLADTETSTTRTSVPLPLRFSAIPPATSAAHRWAALELRFASLLMGRAMIRRRIRRQLIRWQVRPGRLKRRHGMHGIRMFRFCGIQV
jgi:hypothetical protein